MFKRKKKKVDGKTVKKIRRRKGGTEEARRLRMYFNQDTQAAIAKWQIMSGTHERKDREQLYVTEISPAFTKLAENLINIHKFVGQHDTFDDLKNDCVSFLFETIIKFDTKRGTNAFSYFNVVAKNWLIVKTKQRILNTKRNISFDDDAALSMSDLKLIEERNTESSAYDILDGRLAMKELRDVLINVKNMTKTEGELIAMDSIITMFDNAENIDILNKSSILVYLREISGMNPKQLTAVMQAIRKYYRSTKTEISAGELTGSFDESLS